MSLRRYGLLLMVMSIVIEAAPATACLNDTSVKVAERQYRSQYETNPTPESEKVGRGYNPLGMAAVGIGAGLMGWALIVSGNRYRRRGS